MSHDTLARRAVVVGRRNAGRRWLVPPVRWQRHRFVIERPRYWRDLGHHELTVRLVGQQLHKGLSRPPLVAGANRPSETRSASRSSMNRPDGMNTCPSGTSASTNTVADALARAATIGGKAPAPE